MGKQPMNEVDQFVLSGDEVRAIVESQYSSSTPPQDSDFVGAAAAYLNLRAQAAPLTNEGGSEPIYQWRGSAADAWRDCPVAQYEYVGLGIADAKPGTYGEGWQRRIVYAAPQPSASARQESRCTVGAKCDPSTCTCRSSSELNVAAAPSASPVSPQPNTHWLESDDSAQVSAWWDGFNTAKRGQPSATALTDEHIRRFFVANGDPKPKQCHVDAARALLAAQPSGNKRDAERYQWIREHHTEMMQWDQTGVWYPFDGKVPERLDNAIDAAIAKGEDKQ